MTDKERNDYQPRKESHNCLLYRCYTATNAYTEAGEQYHQKLVLRFGKKRAKRFPLEEPVAACTNQSPLSVYDELMSQLMNET